MRGSTIDDIHGGACGKREREMERKREKLNERVGWWAQGAGCGGWRTGEGGRRRREGERERQPQQQEEFT